MLKLFLIGFILTIGSISCNTASKATTGSKELTEAEATQGIREALEQGVAHAVSLLNKQDGFFNSDSYKLSLPPDAQKIESTLRQLGMGGLADRTILQINRAAEDAVGAARPIFTNAIKQMPITDAIDIVHGQSDAATQYFKQKTTDKLTAAFLPIIKSSLDKFSATKYYSDMVNTYNGFPTTLNKLNPDLDAYVVNKTIEALFDEISKEEATIRTNRKARNTQVLKKAFG